MFHVLLVAEEALLPRLECPDVYFLFTHDCFIFLHFSGWLRCAVLHDAQVRAFVAMELLEADLAVLWAVTQHL